VVAAVAALAVTGAGTGVAAAPDPASARCARPPVTFGKASAFSDHREVSVRFTCVRATLAGTLYLPRGPGRHPAAVWVAGSGPTPRLGFAKGVLPALVRSGVAVLSWDKRGVAKSTGECCPGDGGHFNLLAADVDGALNALRARPDLDRRRIGIVGASQAGWIVPLSVARFGHPLAFTAMADAPAVSYGEERLYSRLTGEEGGMPSGLSPEDIGRRLDEAGPSGFDPRPYLARMTSHGLWLYGGQDRSQPTDRSVAMLEHLKRTRGRAFTVHVFPQAGHGLLDVTPTDPRALPTLVRWVHEQIRLPAAETRVGAGR
jgi:pimeloyl-ACP methyl ester carboxylesterase